MKIHLRVVRGKPQGQALQFPEGEFVFGRGPECHVRPNSELISRQHCLLRVTNAGVHLRDLGSSNGTLVNGTRVIEERHLEDGDVVQLGPLVLQLVFGEKPVVGNQTMADASLLSMKETLLSPPEA